MARIRAWAVRAPLWQIATYYFVAWVLIQTVITGRLLSAVLGGAFFATFMTLFTRGHRRRDTGAAGLGSLDEVNALDRAMRRGDVPDTPPERAAMAGLAQRRHRQARMLLILSPIMFGAFAALDVLLLLTGNGSVGSAVRATLFLVFATWSVYSGLRLRRQAATALRLLEVSGSDRLPADR